MCLPQAGFVSNYGQKLTSDRDLGSWQLQGRKSNSCQDCRTGFFGAFPSFEDSLGGQGLERQEWGFSMIENIYRYLIDEF